MVMLAKPVVLATSEILTLEEVRLHCKVDAEGSPPSAPEDSLLTAYITMAREVAEEYTGRSLAAKTYELRIDAWPVWPAVVELPYSPVMEVESVSYLDSTGLLIAMDPSEYDADLFSEPARLSQPNGAAWPTAMATPGAIRIRYRAGYDAISSPQTLPVATAVKQAMLLTIGEWYRDRENTQPGQLHEIATSARYILDWFKLRRGLA